MLESQTSVCVGKKNTVVFSYPCRFQKDCECRVLKHCYFVWPFAWHVGLQNTTDWNFKPKFIKWTVDLAKFEWFQAYHLITTRLSNLACQSKMNSQCHSGLPVWYRIEILEEITMLQKSLESILSTTFVWSKISSQWILTKLCTVDANSGKKAMFFIYIKNSIWCWSMVTGQDEKINLVESRTIKLWKIYPFNIVYLRFQA